MVTGPGSDPAPTQRVARGLRDPHAVHLLHGGLLPVAAPREATGSERNEKRRWYGAGGAGGAMVAVHLAVVVNSW